LRTAGGFVTLGARAGSVGSGGGGSGWSNWPDATPGKTRAAAVTQTASRHRRSHVEGRTNAAELYSMRFVCSTCRPSVCACWPPRIRI